MRWTYRSENPSNSGLQGAESRPGPAPCGEGPLQASRVFPHLRPQQIYKRLPPNAQSGLPQDSDQGVLLRMRAGSGAPRGQPDQCFPPAPAGEQAGVAPALQ